MQWSPPWFSTKITKYCIPLKGKLPLKLTGRVITLMPYMCGSLSLLEIIPSHFCRYPGPFCPSRHTSTNLLIYMASLLGWQSTGCSTYMVSFHLCNISAKETLRSYCRNQMRTSRITSVKWFTQNNVFIYFHLFLIFLVKAK